MADEHGRHRNPDEVDDDDASAPDETPDADDDKPAISDEEALAFLKHPAPQRGKQVIAALVVGVLVVGALGALVAWLGQRELQLRRDDALHEMYLTAGKQVAVNLTTIDYRHVDDGIKRALDTSTGAYFDDFKQRSTAVVDSVKQQQSASVGTVTEAGVESANDTSGVVLVAVKVHTEVGNGPPQRDRYWRVRLTMQKVGDSAKVSKVEPIQ
ncbi:Mce protein [Mycobacterium sp. SMC-18]|uniref:Mce protein n=1 Tax=Mycobacterium sp. SMC-18 TaxID=3381629 RepID=UPI00387749D1